MQTAQQVICGLALFCVMAAAGCSTAPSASRTLNDEFPGLTPGCLNYATLEHLPPGVLLRSGDVVVLEKDLADEIGNLPPFVREQCESNSVFVLEQFATERLLSAAARQQAVAAGEKPSTQPDRAAIQRYLDSAPTVAKVSDGEARSFFAQNTAMFGDSSFDQVQNDLKAYLLSERQAKATSQYVQALGRRMPISVSDRWVRQQAAKMRENPVDEARASGKPTLVAFGTGGCCGPDLEPLLAEVGQQMDGNANIVFINVKEAGVLAARFGIEDVPAEIFFDKAGRESYRHTGMLQADDMAKRLTGMGGK